MSLSQRTMYHLIVSFAILSTVRSFSMFQCDENACTCKAERCEHLCKTAECLDQLFFCTSSSSLCSINCIGADSCKDAQVYAAADNVILNCNSTDACSDMQIFCGIPPAPSELFSMDEFLSPMTECFINLMSPNAMSNAEITCSGSIGSCEVNAVKDDSISQSTFDCSTDATGGDGCQLNCLNSASCSNIDFECAAETCTCGPVNFDCQQSSQITFTQSDPPDYANPPSDPPSGDGNNDSNDTNPDDDGKDRSMDYEYYNCIDLKRTELDVQSLSINDQSRNSTFTFEITGKDNEHNTTSFRYLTGTDTTTNTDDDSSDDFQDFEDGLLSELHAMYRSEDFIGHETHGTSSNFQFTFNAPSILCWKTSTFDAIKLDVYYNHNTTFAFTYINAGDMRDQSYSVNPDTYTLTGKPNWESGITYLISGRIYFDYHYNVSLQSIPSFTLSPFMSTTTTTTISKDSDSDSIDHRDESTTTNTPSDSIIIISSQPTKSESDEQNGSLSPSPPQNEGQALETTDDDGRNSGNFPYVPDGEHSISMPSNSNTPSTNSVDWILIVVIIIILCMICGISGCILRRYWWLHKKGKIEYSSAAGDDSDTDNIGGASSSIGGGYNGYNGYNGYHHKGSEADIEDEDIVRVIDVVTPGGPQSLKRLHHHGHHHHELVSGSIVSDDEAGYSMNGHNMNLHRNRNEQEPLQMKMVHLDSISSPSGRSGRRGKGKKSFTASSSIDHISNGNGSGIGSKERKDSRSQSSQFKKYGARNAKVTIARNMPIITMSGSPKRERSRSHDHSASGIGYLAASQMISTKDLSDDEDEGTGDESSESRESLIARERDISIDDEYHHVIARPHHQEMERDSRPFAFSNASQRSQREGRHHYNESLDQIDNPMDDDDGGNNNQFDTMIVHGNGVNGHQRRQHPSQDPIIRSSSDIMAENGRTAGASIVSAIDKHDNDAVSVQSIGSIATVSVQKSSRRNSDRGGNNIGNRGSNRPSESSLGFEPGSAVLNYTEPV